MRVWWPVITLVIGYVMSLIGEELHARRQDRRRYAQRDGEMTHVPD